MVRVQGYEQDCQLTGINAANGATTIQNLTNGFDASGNISSITDNLTSGCSQTVTYDNLNRVHTAGGIYGSQTYAYDGVGNRQSLAVGSTTSAYTYASAANQIASITNTTPISTGTGAYLYNAFRQRVQKVAGAVTTQFVYDQGGHLLEEADGSGTVQKEYIWLDDMPVAMVDSSGSSPVLYFIHTDQLGTPQKLTDGSMNVVWDGVADPFGNPASGSSVALTNLRFPGQYFDAEAGLNQNWNRDYDPVTGRYIQSDLIGLNGGPNTYAYANNNPVIELDRFGLASFPPPPSGVPGGPWTPAGSGQRQGTWYGPKQPSGQRPMCRYTPPYRQGGPPGSKGYWTTGGGDTEQRWNSRGQPITAEQAHPNPLPSNPLLPFIRFGGPLGIALAIVFYSGPAY